MEYLISQEAAGTKDAVNTRGEWRIRYWNIWNITVEIYYYYSYLYWGEISNPNIIIRMIFQTHIILISGFLGF